jgi:hypothetical protein
MSEGNGKVTDLHIVKNGLDPYAEMFRLREEAIEDEGLREFYPKLVNIMRRDAAQRGIGGAVEMLMIERVAFEYVWMRDREAMGIGVNGLNPANPDEPPGYAHERSWRDTITQWYEMASRLQKAVSKEEPDPSFIRDQTLREVGVIVGQVCDQYPDMADELKEKFAEAFDQAEEEVSAV